MRLRVLIAVLLTMIMALPASPLRLTAAMSCGDHVSAPATPAATPSKVNFPAFPEDGGELHIMAAASLTDAFGEIESVLEERHPELDITIETAGSQTLVTQLQQGAEADVLATADLATMQAAVEDELVSGEPVPFTANRLVIATPSDNPASIQSLDDLAADGLSLVLAGPKVPAGSYARMALCTHAETMDDPEAFLARVDANLASEEPDVRHVLTKLLLGEADAGIIYASDAFAAEDSGTPLGVIELPDSLRLVPAYPIAPVEGGDTELALAFIGFVLSDDGQEILADGGFSRP